MKRSFALSPAAAMTVPSAAVPPVPPETGQGDAAGLKSPFSLASTAKNG